MVVAFALASSEQRGTKIDYTYMLMERVNISRVTPPFSLKDIVVPSLVKYHTAASMACSVRVETNSVFVTVVSR